MKRTELKRKTPLRSGSGLKRTKGLNGGRFQQAAGGITVDHGGGADLLAKSLARSTLKPGKRLAKVGPREQRHRPEDDVCRAEVKAEGCLCGCGATGEAVDWAHLDGRAGSRHKRHLFCGLHRSLHEWIDGARGAGGGLAKRDLRILAKQEERRPTTDEFWEAAEGYGCPEHRGGRRA